MKGNVNFLKMAGGRRIFIINDVLRPRAETWARVSSLLSQEKEPHRCYSFKRLSPRIQSSSQNSGRAQAWIDCVLKSQGANIDHVGKCWSFANNQHSPA